MLRRTLLLVVLGVAAAARFWHLTAGVPHAVGIDESQVIDRALRILKTGDWNTHAFDHPSLVIYFHAAVAIVRFLWGALNGEWASLDGFSIVAVYKTGRSAAALVGVATVWLTYKLGVEVAGHRVALVAAALLAVAPMHVRESHYILTDVPMTALATLALWFAVRAARLATVRAYAWAGAISGLAAAAKYTGGVAFAAVAAAWLINERRARGRGLKIAAAAGATVLGFLVGAPYTLFDMPAFLDGFAAQFSRVAAPSRAGSPALLLSVAHVWMDGRVVFLFALAGIVLVLARRSPRATWAPVLAFLTAYFYVLSKQADVFGRYVLPLLPGLSVLAAAAAIEVIDVGVHARVLARPAGRFAVPVVVLLALLYGPVTDTVDWLNQQRHADTRTIAADWLKTNVPRGTRVAVENSGPTYLDAAGFALAPVEQPIDHDVAWFRARADYLIVSESDLTRYRGLLEAGPTVFQIAPTPQRWGPPIRIVKLGNLENR
jgi:4-amino-4-deoxy-L-arabinose transferase-like glycosyltransferase